MKISSILKFLLSPFMMYAVEGDGGGASDRGDDFVPTDGDEAPETDKVEDDKPADEPEETKAEEKPAEAKKASPAELKKLRADTAGVYVQNEILRPAALTASAAAATSVPACATRPVQHSDEASPPSASTRAEAGSAPWSSASMTAS